MITKPKIMAAVRLAEAAYARMDRMQDHLATDSDDFIELGPIVPWVEQTAAKLSGATVEEVHAVWFAAVKV